jgi:hypothetical protein
VSQEPKCSAIKAILQDLSLPKTGFVRNRKPQQLPLPPVTENMKSEELLKGGWGWGITQIDRGCPCSKICLARNLFAD